MVKLRHVGQKPPIQLWFDVLTVKVIHTIFTLIKPFIDTLCPVGGGTVILKVHSHPGRNTTV